MSGDVVVMLGALELEYRAVRDLLSGVGARHERGTRFEVGDLQGLLLHRGHRVGAVGAAQRLRVDLC